MGRLIALVLSTYLITSLARSAEPIPKGIEVLALGLTAPEASFADPSGAPATLGNFRGKTVILNVWATWCGPCRKEMPSLDRLADKLDPNKAVVLAVSQDKGGSVIAKQFLEKLGTKNISAFADPSNKLSRKLGIRGLPTTFLISPTGAIVGRVEGPLDWDSPEVVRFCIIRGQIRTGYAKNL